MKSKFLKPIFALLLLAAPIWPTHAETPSNHQRVRFKNDFKKPEQVIQYYCSRDASGFVWSGLLDVERKKFTLWQTIPRQESFFIASAFNITRTQVNSPNLAQVTVEYDITGVSDSNGQRMPPTEKKRVVTFVLKKVDQEWKIEKPLPTEIFPVVVESVFPLAKL